ncbi:hypothetical protein D3C75_281990 [compost metagenome]
MVVEKLLTKCCGAETKTDRDQYDPHPIEFCSHCKKKEPEMEQVEMCEWCKRPAKYCVCP